MKIFTEIKLVIVAIGLAAFVFTSSASTVAANPILGQAQATVLSESQADNVVGMGSTSQYYAYYGYLYGYYAFYYGYFGYTYDEAGYGGTAEVYYESAYVYAYYSYINLYYAWYYV